MSSAHISASKRHPLVEAWIDAGNLVDATYAALYGGSVYGTPYYSFSAAFAESLADVDQYTIRDKTETWCRSAEQNCRVAATKQVVKNMLNALRQRADAAAEALAMSSDAATTPASELYRVYLDNFIEYLTPSLKQGKVVDGHVVDPYVVRSRCGTYTDVNMLRAQAQGVVDAQMMLDGAFSACPKMPRTLDGFCEHLGIVRK